MCSNPTMQQPSLNFRPAALGALVVNDPALHQFHPVVGAWFEQTLGEPTEPQRRAWPLIAQGKDVLLSAPTGSGKTLAAFLACLNRLFLEALDGRLNDEVRIVYVSPLRALSNDVQKNLLRPLQELTDFARAHGYSPQPIRVAVRTGDTPASERAQMLRKAPHILITTPESLFLCITAEKSRAILKLVDTIIIDEIHALLRDKRGAHLALSLERMKDLSVVTPQMIGLSATQRPIQRVAAYLVAKSEEVAAQHCEIIEVGHQRPWQLSVEVPDEPLSCVASHEMWGQVYERILQWSKEHRTLLIFVNTRRLAERMAHDLGERMGDESLVRAHHGSMAREPRLEAEERLKSGQLRIMVATASLELGIDIGAIDLVVQIGSPRAMSTALQRVGRAGHHKNGISRGAFVALTRDELVEVTALLDAVRRGELDQLVIPQKPLDILAQHVIAACATMPQEEDQLFAWVKRAWTYRDLTREEFDSVLKMVSDGVTTNRGKLRTLVFRDRVTSTLRPKPAARMVAIANAGAIPDTFSYPVIAEPEGKAVGSVDEDFAIDSMTGDVFLLGSTAWRIQRVIAGTVRVEDAGEQPPSVPVWQGEAPSRTFELSAAVAHFRERIVALGAESEADAWLRELGIGEYARKQLIEYLCVSAKILGAMPTQKLLVAERFFDDAGGMQLVIHSPFGGRINRAFGHALRKRFCRSFDFELQAAAGDDGVLLSLGAQHSFPLIDIFAFVSPNVLDEVLSQAVLQAPLFGTRFRWNASRALLLERMQRGERVPPQIQRARSDDLLAAIFPAQAGCQDNHGGEYVELPDHPIVNETMKDCLTEALDIEGLRTLLQGIKDGTIRTLAVDLPEPSPMAHQHLNSAPYTFLDDAPLEERRARAVSMRRTLPAADAVAFGTLDERAIAKVVEEANLKPRSPDELHEWLLDRCYAPLVQVVGDASKETLGSELLNHLLASRRASIGVPPGIQTASHEFVVPVDRLALWLAIHGPRPAVAQAVPSRLSPHLDLLPGDTVGDREDAIIEVVRGHMECAGPITSQELGHRLALSESDVEQAMCRLEATGSVLRGQFRPRHARQETSTPVYEHEWCDRRLLQRIHRLTVGRLRSEIEPLAARDTMRFLLRWHGIASPLAAPVGTESGALTGPLPAIPPLAGRAALLRAIDLLEGFEAPAVAWEKWLLEPRVRGYEPDLLDRMCLSGELVWGRLFGLPHARTSGASQNAAQPTRRGAVVYGNRTVQQLSTRAELIPADPSTVAPSTADASTADASPADASPADAGATELRISKALSLTFMRRAVLPLLAPLPAERTPHPDPVVEAVAQALGKRGALFVHELASLTKLKLEQVEGALWQLIASGDVVGDDVENLRLLSSSRRKKAIREQLRSVPNYQPNYQPTITTPVSSRLAFSGRSSSAGRLAMSGRFALLSPPDELPADQAVSKEQRTEAIARSFLQRYGLVWRDLVMREALATTWHDLSFCYRRMEARGELRGGRFIAGVVGEQFALPEAIELARSVRREAPWTETITLAGIDPLNLTGVLFPGARVPSQHGQRLLLRDGLPLLAQADQLQVEPESTDDTEDHDASDAVASA